MRQFLIFILISLLNIPLSYSAILNEDLTVESSSVVGGIENGWYQATVQYSNSNTGTNSTYTLNVKVEYNRVVKIDFGNGGSVHTGFNNEGYIYSGGYLYFSTDYKGNISSANATVTVSDSNGMKYFKITIE